ncbi:hypothetical protein KO529_10430 [Arenibacter algicola]|uniref:hypothetical protein n=1 Tax=Arenibacter algicola TaxID=616991 RepID=UPI001C06A230|nr:hypothetical protein [Arenibacter algicola]MBU2905201.1 hypothetical protein [Arenibacter algicola]
MSVIIAGPVLSQSQHNVMDGLAENVQSLSSNNRPSKNLQTNNAAFEAGGNLLYKAYSLDPSVAEKIYIQLHSNAYATDQDIWFKAIVTGTENHGERGQYRFPYNHK